MSSFDIPNRYSVTSESRPAPFYRETAVWSVLVPGLVWYLAWSGSWLGPVPGTVWYLVWSGLVPGLVLYLVWSGTCLVGLDLFHSLIGLADML